MTRCFALITASLGLMISAMAQPAIRFSTPVLNSASYIGPELTGTGAGIAQGSLFALFGSGFGAPDSYAQATSYPLAPILGGVSVQVTVGNTTTNAIMLNVYYGQQINAVLPSATPVGTGTITVTYAGMTSAPAPIVVVANSFGIYTANSQGSGQAAATDAGFGQNSIIHTYHPGDVVILWGTGLGAVTWDETEPPPASAYVDLPVPVQVYVGTAPAPAGPADYHGRSAYAGLDQLVFTVPAGVEGCYVPVGVKAGAVMSNIVTIAVSNAGSTCSDSIIGQDLTAQLAAGQNVNFAWIRLEGGAGTGDFISATFNAFTPDTAKLASYGVSSGYCTSMEWGAFDGPMPNDFTLPYLNAGPQLTMQGPTGSYQAFEAAYPTGTYLALVSPNGVRTLLAGFDLTVTGPGGTNVGRFTITDRMPVLGSRITNISQGQFRPRNSDLVVTWNPSQFPQPAGQVFLGGASYVFNPDGSEQIGAELQCSAPAAAGTFTIPAWVLSLFPPSGAQLNGTPTGYMWLGQYSDPKPFAATGLDKGIISTGTFAAVTVGFQ